MSSRRILLSLCAVFAAAALFIAFHALRVSSPTAGGCHIAMHAKGEAAYEENRAAPQAGVETPPKDASSCGWGFYHAYLEALFEDHPDASLAATLCATLGEGKSDAPAIRRVCFGSAGSGFLRALLPAQGGPKLSESAPLMKVPLAQCETLGAAPSYAPQACKAGVFGELIYRSMAGGWRFSPGDLLRLCEPYSGETQLECYRKAGASLFLAGNYSLKALTVFSNELPTGASREAAFKEGVEVFLIDPRHATAPKTLLIECLGFATDKTWCAQAVARGLFDASLSDTPEREVAQFCASAEVRERGLDAACAEDSAALMQSIYEGERLVQFCGMLPPEFGYLCAHK